MAAHDTCRAALIPVFAVGAHDVVVRPYELEQVGGERAVGLAVLELIVAADRRLLGKLGRGVASLGQLNERVQPGSEQAAAVRAVVDDNVQNRRQRSLEDLGVLFALQRAR